MARADGASGSVKQSSLPRRRRWISRNTKPIARRSWLKRSLKPIPQVNVARLARRVKVYQAHMASVYWFALRYAAFKRDGGLCQCPDCITFRKDGGSPEETRVECWFDTRGKVHGFDTHHTTYARFGHELLSDVLTMIHAHHRKVEREKGFRKHWLRGSR